MSSWIPLYEQISRKLLEFEHRQAELLELLRDFAGQGLQIPSLEDQDAQGGRFPLAEIDPFTFFALFNWQGRKPENRSAILAALRTAWQLDAPVPSDFDGLPLGNPQQLWYFGYSSRREEGDIARLWQFARGVVEGTRVTLDRALWTRLLQQRSIGEVKLSIGMFWLNPREFLPADKWMRGYMERRGVPAEIWNGETYFDWLEASVVKAGTDFVQISHDAFIEKQAPEGEDGGEEADHRAAGPRFWVMQAGPGAEAWDDFRTSRTIAVGFPGMGDFQQFADKAAIRARIRELWPKEGEKGSPYNSTLAALQFSREMQAGDTVFVFGGFYRMLGVARVTGAYEFGATLPSYQHRRPVAWLALGPWTVGKELSCPMKTLTMANDAEKNRARLAVAGLKPDGAKPAPVGPSRRFWWLNANPKFWSIGDMPVGERQIYTSHNEQGNKRQKFKYFSEVAPGDRMVGYLTNPDKEIVAFGHITQGLHVTAEGEGFEIEKTEAIPRPVTWEELQQVPALAGCEPLINNMGSLFALTEEEFDMIRALVDERNPPALAARQPYTHEKARQGLFMEASELETILARLERKKGIILQGPPGVGKTFVARRLAYALMGEEDESRVCMVQFHPSYGYEDFIQGYRPDRGGLRLRDGVFYEIVRRARRDARPHVFIIDEINRGNLAKIFGELLMLLEADKRGPEFALPLTYAESAADTFWLPENLHVIGTMNTADRSLAMVDYALRRRFAFVELDPALHREEFRAWLQAKGAPAALVSRIADRLGKLNAAIAQERDLGEGFRIGHSYFCPGKTPPNWEAWYVEVIEAEIAPLLKEYFEVGERVRELKKELLAP